MSFGIRRGNRNPSTPHINICYPALPVRFPPPLTSSPLMSSLVISAPGKVLIAGGYLVLDPAYTGVVASTSSRFYTAITPGNTNRIVVRSPQFVNATWSYTWSISSTTTPPSVIISQVERYLPRLRSTLKASLLSHCPVLSHQLRCIEEQICTSRTPKDPIARLGSERPRTPRTSFGCRPRRHNRRR